MSNQLETYLNRVHTHMLAIGAARIFHVPTPVQITKRLGHGRVSGRLGKAVWSDYSGCMADGRAVAGEAKELQTKSSNLTKARLPKHQQEALAWVAEHGGIAWVYVRRIWEGDVTDYLVPVTSMATFASSIKLLKKYIKPPEMHLHDATQDWADYIEKGWKNVKKWTP